MWKSSIPASNKWKWDCEGASKKRDRDLASLFYGDNHQSTIKGGLHLPLLSKVGYKSLPNILGRHIPWNAYFGNVFIPLTVVFESRTTHLDWSTMDDDLGPTKRPRKACERCRRRKQRCHGFPACSNCQLAKEECIQPLLATEEYYKKYFIF